MVAKIVYASRVPPRPLGGLRLGGGEVLRIEVRMPCYRNARVRDETLHCSFARPDNT